MKVTIAIPFYNAEKFLADAIRSVFAQTHQDWELILIDDGSTDKSLQIARSVQDPRVRVISDGENKKLAGRLNEVTKLAKYDFIARMDADDLIFPNRIEKQINYLKQNPDLDIVTTGVYSILNDLTIKGVRGQDYEYPSFLDILKKKKSVIHAALLARKSWYERNKYDESLSVAQDLDLWLRASKKDDFKVKSISDPLYMYREENNITTDKILRAYRNERVMIRKYAKGVIVVKMIMLSFIKSTVVRTLILFGQMDVLQKRRGKEVINSERIQNFDVAIQKIKSTIVPGLD